MGGLRVRVGVHIKIRGMSCHKTNLSINLSLFISISIYLCLFISIFNY